MSEFEGGASMSFIAIWVILLGVGVLVGLLAGLIVLLVKWPKAGLAVVGGAVVVLLMVGMAGLSYRQMARTSVIGPMPQSSGPGGSSMPAEWDPDVHPSVREAVLSRVPMMEGAIRNLTGGADSPKQVHVRGDVDIDLLREFGEHLLGERAFADAHTNVTWRDGDQAATGEVVTVNVNKHVERQRTQHWSHGGVRQDFHLWRDGRVMVTVARNGRTQSVPHARFIEKPWVNDWSGFVAMSVPGQNWLRAESRSPATSPQEAQEEAIEQAVNMLVPLVQSSLHGPVPLRQDLAGEIRGRLSQGQLIMDRFVQRVDRPYGELYSAVLLIDGSSAAVNGLAADLSLGQTVRRKAVLSTAGSLAALIGVVGLLYLFLNTVTKGYYRPQLVVVMLLAAATVVFVVMVV